jgi:hypothetical protein
VLAMSKEYILEYKLNPSSPLYMKFESDSPISYLSPSEICSELFALLEEEGYNHNLRGKQGVIFARIPSYLESVIILIPKNGSWVECNIFTREQDETLKRVESRRN